MKTVLLPTLRILLLVFSTLIGSLTVSAQAEVFVNQISGKPLVAGATFVVEDDKFSQLDKESSTEEVRYVDNRLILQLTPGPGKTVAPGTYRLLAEIRYWMKNDDAAKAAPNGVLRELVVEVKEEDHTIPRVSFPFAGGRKLAVEIKTVSFNDGPLPKDAPGMKLIGEIATQRSFCNLSLSQVPPDVNLQLEQYKRVVNVTPLNCADEYDLEYLFYDRDSKIGQQIANNQGLDDLYMDPLFKNEGSRLTSASTMFRLFDFYRDGFIIARYRGVQYDQNGLRRYTRWSTRGTTLADYQQRIGEVTHQEEFNWQMTNNFAEEAKQLPSVSYLDGTMRGRQNLVLQYDETNPPANEWPEFAIAQQTIYDGMGRPAVTTLPAPLYPEEVGGPHPLVFDPDMLMTTTDGNTYGTVDVEKASCDGSADPVGADAGAGKYFSKSNVRLKNNAFVPDGQMYPFSVSRYTADNTGRIRRQGGVGPLLQPGAHETRYFYGKANQWELDRLFGVNVGDASHYEKRMVIDPNGQASISYIDTKGRTVATALAGKHPGAVDPLPSYAAASTMPKIEIDILNNVREEYAVTATYSLLVVAEEEYNICYALGEAIFDECCDEEDDPDGEENDSDERDKSMFSPRSDCPSCVYDLTLTLTGDCNWRDGVPIVIEERGLRDYGSLNDCLGAGGELSAITLPVGEYHLTKRLTVNQEALNNALEEHLADENCVDTEQDFIDQYIDQLDYEGCNTCDCPSVGFPSPIVIETLNGQNIKDDDDSCIEYCANASPCDLQARLMMADLSPGGQYAGFVVNDDFSYDVDENPINIFAIPEGGDFPFFQTPGLYGNLTIMVDGEDVSPGSLSMQDFITLFRDEWAASLLPYHPEFCFVEQCADLQVVPSTDYNSSSNDWDINLRATATLQAADDDAIDQYALLVDDYEDALYSMVAYDPYFVEEGSPEFNTFLALIDGNGNPGFTPPDNDIIFKVISYMTITFGTAPPNAWSWNDAPEHEQDIAWRMLRDLYLGKKLLFIEQQMIAACAGENTHEIHGDGWQCLIQPVCQELTCDTPVDTDGMTISCSESDYADFTARVTLLTRLVLFDADDTELDQDEITNESTPSEDEQAVTCAATCADYRPAWRERLEDCDAVFSAADITFMLDRFEEICTAGCTYSDRPAGTSSADEDDDDIDLPFYSFIDVIDHVLSQADNNYDCLNCNPYLINFPPPHDQNFYSTSLVISADQVIVWLQTNRDFLYDALLGVAECSYCRVTPDPNCAAVIVAELNRLPVDVVNETITTIANFVFTTPGSFPSPPQDLVIPAEFNPMGEICQNSLNIRSLLSGMSSCDLGNSDELLAFQTQYLNAALGWNRTEEEYALIIEGSPGYDSMSTCVICADPLPEIIAEPGPTCEEEMNQAATDQATVAYEQYIELEAAGFENRYRNYCLDNSTERMMMAYHPFEHHYTLYYYDQSGNLTMTVPPEGVAPIPGEDIHEGVHAYRDGLVESVASTPPVLPKHTLLTDYTYNNFDEVSASDSPDRTAARSWYDPLGRVVMSQDGRQADESSTGNGNLVSYTLYDELGRVKEVGEMQSFWSEQGLVFEAESGNIFSAVDAASVRKFVTKTYYTDSEFDIPNLAQNELTLRNRVSAVTFEKEETYDTEDYDFASHYNYDIAGNVDELVQEFRELEDIGHQYKKIEYDYDLISGNVHAVFYQRGYQDQFTYRYEYDRTNRLTNVYTSTTETEHSNSANWKRDAAYTYFDYGPLKRMVIGQDRLQGVDYAYTLQGWIKGINGGWGTRRDWKYAQYDIGSDGIALDNNGFGIDEEESVGYRDLYRYVNKYFKNDYIPIALSEVEESPFRDEEINSLYNGNISAHKTLTVEDTYADGILNARYDQLHRLLDAQYSAAHHSNTNLVSFAKVNNTNNPSFYYDANGNIKRLSRDWERRTPQYTTGNNVLKYTYAPGSNRLLAVDGNVDGPTNHFPFQPVANGQQYGYDGSGNLVSHVDGVGQVGRLEATLDWTPYGKVNSVSTNTPQVADDETRTVTYGYGPDQNRWVKANHRDFAQNGILTDAEYQVRDAQGNTLTTYYRGTTTDIEGGTTSTPFTWRQQYLFGSSRLGQVQFEHPLDPNCAFIPGNAPCNITDEPVPPGDRRYELSNHLGNVTTVFGERTDFRTQTSGQFSFLYEVPRVHRFTDYLPFGLELERTVDDAGSGGNSGDFSYRYGFNSKEKGNDGEWGTLTNYDYGFRIYNPGIAKFLSVDPLAPEYPELTPYQFASLSPIQAIDLDGLEAYVVIFDHYSEGPFPDITISYDKSIKEIRNSSFYVIHNYYNEEGFLEAITTGTENKKSYPQYFPSASTNRSDGKSEFAINRVTAVTAGGFGFNVKALGGAVGVGIGGEAEIFGLSGNIYNSETGFSDDINSQFASVERGGTFPVRAEISGLIGIKRSVLEKTYGGGHTGQSETELSALLYKYSINSNFEESYKIELGYHAQFLLGIKNEISFEYNPKKITSSLFEQQESERLRSTMQQDNMSVQVQILPQITGNKETQVKQDEK